MHVWWRDPQSPSFAGAKASPRVPYYSWSKEFLEAGKCWPAGDTARAATTDEVSSLRREAQDLKEVVAEQALELRCSKKHDRGWGGANMRLPASEKLEIIRSWSSNRICRPGERLSMLGIKPSTFYRWYDRHRSSGPEALEDKPSKPGSGLVNRIPDDVRQRVVMMAFEQPELSSRELATSGPPTPTAITSRIIGLSAIEGP